MSIEKCSSIMQPLRSWPEELKMTLTDFVKGWDSHDGVVGRAGAAVSELSKAAEQKLVTETGKVE